MDENIPNALPDDMTDYYYRFRISAIEKTKAEYNKIFDVFIENKKSIFENLSSKETDSIFKKLGKLNKHFNDYADKIIKKDGISTCEDFSYHMENLMLVANEAILFCEESIILNKKIDLKLKLKFDGRKISLNTIISYLKNIPYDLNLDEPINVLTNRFQFFIVLLILLLMVILLLSGLYFIVSDNEVYSYVNNVYSFLPFKIDYLGFMVALVSGASGVFLFFKIIYSKGYRSTDAKSFVYSRIKNIVYKPYKTDKRVYKYSLKAIKYVLDYFKS